MVQAKHGSRIAVKPCKDTFSASLHACFKPMNAFDVFQDAFNAAVGAFNKGRRRIHGSPSYSASVGSVCGPFSVHTANFAGYMETPAYSPLTFRM